MGSGGQSFGGTGVLKVKEYHTVARIGKILWIDKNRQPGEKRRGSNTPTYSSRANAIYATTRGDGQPKQITVYGPDKKKLYDIDLDHDHTKNKAFPNGHIQYYDKSGNRQLEYYPPNREQRRLVEEFRKGVKKRGKRR